MSSKRMLLFSRKGSRERVPTASKALSPLIPLCGLDFVLVAHARHSLSKLNSAFDFVDFAIARHSSNKFDSALA